MWWIVGIVAGLFLLGCKKQPRGENAMGPINTNPDRIKEVSLQYRKLEDPGAYRVIIDYENGDHADYDFVLDNPDDFKFWIEQAQLDGATITEIK